MQTSDSLWYVLSFPCATVLTRWHPALKFSQKTRMMKATEQLAHKNRKCVAIFNCFFSQDYKLFPFHAGVGRLLSHHIRVFLFDSFLLPFSFVSCCSSCLPPCGLCPFFSLLLCSKSLFLSIFSLSLKHIHKTSIISLTPEKTCTHPTEINVAGAGKRRALVCCVAFDSRCSISEL